MSPDHAAVPSPEYRPAIPPGFKAYLGLEATTAQMHAYDAEFMPGLLQTEEYIRAIHRRAHQGLSSGEIDRLVAVRLTCQEILTRSEHPLKLNAIVNEAVLRRVVGGPDVTRAQLAHLTDAAQQPNIKIQVVPFSAGTHPGMNGPFIVLRFPEGTVQPIVYLENLASAEVTNRAEDVEKYEDAFDDLTASALDHERSLHLIEAAAKEFWMRLYPDTLNGLTWFKSSHSNDQGGACVEGAHLPCGGMAVRDSKTPHGPALRISAQAWQALIKGVRNN